MQMKFLKFSVNFFSTRKFASARSKSKFANSDDPQPNFTNIDKDLFEQYRKSLKAETIIKEFRRQVFRREDENELMEVQNLMNKQGKSVEDMLDRGSKEQIIQKAKKIGQRFSNHQNIYLGNSLKSTLSDYGDYTVYNSVKPVIRDRNLQQDEQLNADHSHERLYKFIDKLDDDFKQKAEVRNYLDYNFEHPQYKDMSVSEFGYKVQGDINSVKHILDIKRDHASTHDFNKIQRSDEVELTHEFTSIDRTLDPYDHGPGLNATLSPQAMDTIYELYTQGWSVRQISQRYGILPARAKFCIWARAYLWHEVLPKIGAKYYLHQMQKEDDYESGISYIDYGLDLEDLNNNDNLEEIIEWNQRMLDSQRGQDPYEYQKAVEKLNQQKRHRKYELVQVGTYGRDNYMYKLKEWRVFRGKGSDQYHLKNTTFRKMSKKMRKFNKVYY